jgi:hypothetical protein
VINRGIVLSGFDRQKTRYHGIFDGSYSLSDTELRHIGCGIDQYNMHLYITCI